MLSKSITKELDEAFAEVRKLCDDALGKARETIFASSDPATRETPRTAYKREIKITIEGD